MLNLPIQSKYSLAPLFIALISIILFLTEPMSSNWLAYDRQQLIDLQWWRLISGHFLHTNGIHLLLNLAGLTLLWALHGHYYPTLQYLFLFFMLCVGTSGGLYLFAPQMYWYVGLSGVLHGLFLIGAYFDIQNKLKSGWIMLVGVWLKVLHEQIYGASENVAELISANVAIDAHLFGTVTGSLILLYCWYRNIKRK
ncbi:rhombosortase [uncultured Paraglaciecola sp.]|uniref:rhombosortase n=1 Tax=uncultured Paraglaciecola sp. TaxID=1765024 RepID=UPI0030DC6C38